MKYTIAIETKDIDVAKGKSYIESLRQEVNSDKNDYALAEKINKATTQVHKEICEAKIKEIREVLSPLGAKVSGAFPKNGSNGYNGWYFNVRIGNAEYYFTCEQFISTRTSPTKYCVYTDAPEFRYKKTTRDDGRLNTGYDKTYSVDSDKLLQVMESSIKIQLSLDEAMRSLN